MFASQANGANMDSYLPARMNPTVIDVHCDLLSYLQDAPHPDPFQKDSIGCSFPALQEGNVKLQVMAIYSSTGKGSTELALKQSQSFADLLRDHTDRVYLVNETGLLPGISESSKTGMLAAIENASCFCEEDEPMDSGFNKLETIIKNTSGIFYIGLTHHAENRFGGGNATMAGLKEDGKVLLDYLDGKKIAVDLSHTSDRLAYEILDYIVKGSLEVPAIASHSNFRSIYNHPRNLPDDIAKEIVRRNGLIGINFLRAFLNPADQESLYDHIQYGVSIGAAGSLCFGADYFYTDSHPDQTRKPFFFKEHDNASCYPSILEKLSERLLPEDTEGISNKNVLNFLGRLWG